MGVAIGNLVGIYLPKNGEIDLALYIVNGRGMGKLLWCSKLSHNNTDSVLNAVLCPF